MGQVLANSRARRVRGGLAIFRNAWPGEPMFDSAFAICCAVRYGVCTTMAETRSYRRWSTNVLEEPSSRRPGCLAVLNSTRNLHSGANLAKFGRIPDEIGRNSAESGQAKEVDPKEGAWPPPVKFGRCRPRSAQVWSSFQLGPNSAHVDRSRARIRQILSKRC